MTFLAIDPGSSQSAWVNLTSDGTLSSFAIWDNDELLRWFRGIDHRQEVSISAVVIEKIESYGMAVGVDIFDTVYWSGRFAEAADPLPVHRLGRKAIKLHLCGSVQAKDSNIRRRLMDLYGGDASIKKGGPLYGVKRDIWAALAVAVAWTELHGRE